MSAKPFAEPNCADGRFLIIVGRASSIWERIGALDDQGQDPTVVREGLLARWARTIDAKNRDGRILHRRLAWDDIQVRDARRALARGGWPDGAPQPEWAGTLGEIMDAAAELGASPTVCAAPPVREGRPLPFEGLLLAAIVVARRHLAVRARPDAGDPPLLTPRAHFDLERTLLHRLAAIASEPLFRQFEQARPAGPALLSRLVAGVCAPDGCYKSFVRQALRSGLASVFDVYPVLGRLVATTVDQWVSTTAELLERLASDQPLLANAIGGGDRRLGRVVRVRAELSDRHDGGRSVMMVSFDGGIEFLYKPKDLDLDDAFDRLLAWCNGARGLLPFRIERPILRRGYGWARRVPHESCADEAAVERFYRRSGAMLCLLYVLGATDGHFENLVACGEHPVLVDAETLLAPRLRLAAGGQDDDSEETFWETVLGTGMLPRWEFTRESPLAYDMSGLGSLSDPPRRRCRVWREVNTDAMHVVSAEEPVQQQNVPRLRGVPCAADIPADAVCAGFTDAYRLLLSHRAELLAPGSPLDAFRSCAGRYLFRGTRVYTGLLEASLEPDRLRDGADRSISLDRLACRFVAGDEKPAFWPLLAAEIAALERLDIPKFRAWCGGTSVSIDGDASPDRLFEKSAYERLLARVEHLDPADLERQLRLIRLAVDSRSGGAHAEGEGVGRRRAGTVPGGEGGSRERLIDAADAIGRELCRAATPAADGGLRWVGLQHVAGWDRYQLAPVGTALYQGNAGIAVFLAALARATGMPRYREAALAGLIPVAAASRVGEGGTTGIGGATGIGSLIYGSVAVSRLLCDPAPLQAARVLAACITPARVMEDGQLDVIGGAAGAILGLLALHEATGDLDALARAADCGEHLLARRSSAGEGPRGWAAGGRRPQAGFAHGAAGIAYALVRLYAITKERRHLDAAVEGMEFERRLFATRGDGPDYRTPGALPALLVASWCNGVAGMGLGRLAAAALLPERALREAVEPEIAAAIELTCESAHLPLDHLCCGNTGQAELLLSAGARLGRPSLTEAASKRVSLVLARGHEAGGYALCPGSPGRFWSPGLFQGTAGIGYAFLRTADPLGIPSVLLWE